MSQAIITIEARTCRPVIRQIQPEGNDCIECGDACWLTASEVVMSIIIGHSNKATDCGTLGPLCGSCAQAYQEAIANGDL